MKKVMSYFIIISLSSSCSTLSKSKTYGAITGTLICGVLGASLGKELSPNKESKGFNKLLGGVSGAGLCGVGGYFLVAHLYKSDPRNMEDVPIDFNKKQVSPRQETLSEDYENINFSDLSLEQDYQNQIPIIKQLPDSLRDKVKRQKLIHYQVKPQTIITKDGRTLYFSGGEAIEHRYTSSKGE